MHTLEPGDATRKPGNRLCPVTTCGAAAEYFCFNSRRAFHQTRQHSCWLDRKQDELWLVITLFRSTDISKSICFSSTEMSHNLQGRPTLHTFGRSRNLEVKQKKNFFRAVLTTTSGCPCSLYLVLHLSVTSGGLISEPLKLPHYFFDHKFSWTPGRCNYAL